MIHPSTSLALLLASASAAQAPIAELEGANADDSFGSALLSAGDLNGDGWPELAVGSPGKESSSAQTPGVVQVFSSADWSPLGTAEGALGGTLFGAALANPGDLNGDAVPELIVGSPDEAGRVTVLDGATWSPGPPVELWSVTGAGTGQLGRSVAALDDLDGDGIADVAAGEPFYNVLAPGVGPGRVQLFSGADGSSLGTIEGPSDDLATFGWSLVVIPDLDDDGLRDLAVGAPTADADQGATFTGAVHFVSTRERAIVDTFRGDREDGQVGFALAAGATPDGGTVVFAGEPSQTAMPPRAGRVVQLTADRQGAVRTLEGPSNGGAFGRSLATGLGTRLLLIGEPLAPGALGEATGRLFVVDRSARRRRVTVRGSAPHSEFAAAVTWMPVPGDPLGLFAVGAPGYDVTFDGDQGRVEVYSVRQLLQRAASPTLSPVSGR